MLACTTATSVLDFRFDDDDDLSDLRGPALGCDHNIARSLCSGGSNLSRAAWRPDAG